MKPEDVRKEAEREARGLERLIGVLVKDFKLMPQTVDRMERRLRSLLARDRREMAEGMKAVAHDAGNYDGNPEPRPIA